MPLVFWAHGGIVSERDGLAIARTQIPWWLENGAYPLHFVWETGFVETLKQLLGWRAGRDLVRTAQQGSPICSPVRWAGDCGRR